MKKRINESLASYRELTEAVYGRYEGVQRAIVFFCNVMLSLYIALIVILHNFAAYVPRFRIAAICGLLLFFVIYQAFKLLIVKRGGYSLSRNAERAKLSWKLMAVSSAIVFFVYIVDLLAYYPGGISPDNVTQWKQILSGQFSDWHPAIHTMIIWLVTRIVPTYSFFVGFQILCFSLLSGYMAATLAAWGIKKGWVIAFLVTIVSTCSTRGILLFAWKDTALTIFLLCLSVYMVNIVFSDGQWLQKWSHVGAVAVVSSIVSLVRHNGFFFTVPLGLFVMVSYGKKTKKASYAVAAAVLLVMGISWGVYPLAKVSHSKNQTYTESVGIPMTIMGGVMVRNPEALDRQTKEFLNKIADDETWAKTYKSGNYNSIKFSSPASKAVAEIPPKELISMTLRTIKNAPKESLLEVIALTRMVWNPLDWYHNVSVGITDRAWDVVITDAEMEEMRPIQERSQTLYNDYLRPIIEVLTPERILTTIGIHMLLLLAAGVYSVNRNLGVKALFLFVPSAAYNLGTMLLLCGPDYRFFHYNTVITLPLIIALLARTKEAPDQKQVKPRKKRRRGVPSRPKT